MREILCFGDSNTWGYNPHTQQRYPREARWPSVLQGGLGDGYNVVAEGLNGRTTVWDDPIEPPCKCGLEYLLPCLASHAPLDLVVIMLGTNDLKHRFSLTAFDIAQGAGVLVQAVQKSEAGRDGGAPPVLLIAPPPLARLSDFADLFRGGPEKSARFSAQYCRVAQERGCFFLDAGDAVVTSDADGVHLDPQGHRDLGLAVAAKIRAILADVFAQEGGT